MWYVGVCKLTCLACSVFCVYDVGEGEGQEQNVSNCSGRGSP